MERLFALIDRLGSLAPLGLLVYVLRRSEAERRFLEANRAGELERFREERRELINRVTHPHAMPVATRPIDRRPADVPGTIPAAPMMPRPQAKSRESREELEAALAGRDAWGGVGTAAAPMMPVLPGDNDDVPGPPA